MKVAFTLCSNNYLSQAKVLGDSLLHHNPDYTFIIGLVDKKNIDVDYSFFSPHTIVPIEDIGIENFHTLWQKYNIIELNTAVKASFLKYLIKLYPNSPFFFYFDPDIMIFDKLSDLEKEFELSNILLTPHIVSPIEPDEYWPGENTFLNYGTYNLGFIGLSNVPDISAFLNWWELRTLNLGYINPCEGIFVDQLWINLVPIFFQKTKILRSLGLNAAPWNLHERKNITYKNNKWLMADGSTLTFYHFSSYNYKLPTEISKYYSRYTFQNCPDLEPIYKEYSEALIKNKIEFFSSLMCYYVKKRSEYLEMQKVNDPLVIGSLFKRAAMQLTPPIIWNLGKRFIK